MNNIHVIILTYNEELHIARCLQSVKNIASKITIVDSFSNDNTVEIAVANGAEVLVNLFETQAQQFNWALKNIDTKCQWILRLDADEVVTPRLCDEISERLLNIQDEVHGLFLNRRLTFQGEMVQFGGVNPIKILRLFRYGKGTCEDRFMDEHIRVNGLTEELEGEIVDDNLNTLSFWIAKHNAYSNREAADLLNLEFNFSKHDSVAKLEVKKSAHFKRWIKEKIYSKLPLGLRAFCYYFYRYVIHFGFLDKKFGRSFHFFQGLWYRYLVDAKIDEVKRHMKRQNVDVKEAIRKVLGIEV